MSIETALSRLSAGLDRDEQLARAAAEDHGDTWQARETWWLEGVKHHTVFDAARGELAHVAYAYEENAPHIARQDPKRTFRQVEAIRKVIARHEQARQGIAEDIAKAGEDSLEYAVGIAILSTYAAVFADLASIYTEDTEPVCSLCNEPIRDDDDSTGDETASYHYRCWDESFSGAEDTTEADR